MKTRILISLCILAALAVALHADTKISAFKDVTSVRTNDFICLAQPDLATNARLAIMNLAVPTATHASNFWGQLNVTNFNKGTDAGSTTFLRGDGIWFSVATATSAANATNLYGTVKAGATIEVSNGNALTNLNLTGATNNDTATSNNLFITIQNSTNSAYVARATASAHATNFWGTLNNTNLPSIITSSTNISGGGTALDFTKGSNQSTNAAGNIAISSYILNSTSAMNETTLDVLASGADRTVTFSGTGVRFDTGSGTYYATNGIWTHFYIRLKPGSYTNVFKAVAW